MRLLWVLCQFIIGIYASTHWVVTETGLIQPRQNSPFVMEKSYDLIGFLDQDTRWSEVVRLYHDLNESKVSFYSQWDNLEKITDIDKQLESDENCKRAGPLHLFDWYVSIVEDGKTRKEILDVYDNLLDSSVIQKDVPHCEKISKLKFNMFTFEHLESMANKQNLSVDPEPDLSQLIFPLISVETFGWQLSGNLEKNTTSWFHYNLASIYWRVKGNALKAIECSRRAIFYAPRRYKDIALVNLGLILHQSKHAEDAATVLSAAVDHGSSYEINHFALANAYAAMGEFKSAINHYDACIELKPAVQMVYKNRYGALCHNLLVKKTEKVMGLLRNLRKDLQEYNHKEAEWLKTQALLLRNMKHDEEYDFTDVESNCKKLTELSGLNFCVMKKEGDKHSVISYFLDSPSLLDKWLDEKVTNHYEAAQNIQQVFQNIDKHASLITDIVAKAEHLKVMNGKLKSELLNLLETTQGTLEEADELLTLHENNEKNKMRSERGLESSREKTNGNPIEDEPFEYEGGTIL